MASVTSGSAACIASRTNSMGSRANGAALAM
jgi:hypothetical protein